MKLFDTLLTIIIIMVSIIIAMLLFNTFQTKISDSNYRIMMTDSDVFSISYVSDIQSDPDAYQSLYFERVKYENEIIVRGSFENVINYRVESSDDGGITLTPTFGVWREYYPLSRNDIPSGFAVPSNPHMVSKTYFTSEMILHTHSIGFDYLSAIQLQHADYFDPSGLAIDVAMFYFSGGIGTVTKIGKIIRLASYLYSTARTYNDIKDLVNVITSSNIQSFANDFGVETFYNKNVIPPRQSYILYYSAYNLLSKHTVELHNYNFNTQFVVGYYYPEIIIDDNNVEDVVFDIVSDYLLYVNDNKVSISDLESSIKPFVYKTQIESRLTSFNEMAVNYFLPMNYKDDDYYTKNGFGMNTNIGYMEYYYGGDIKKAGFNPLLIGWRNSLTLDNYMSSSNYFAISPNTPYVFQKVIDHNFIDDQVSALKNEIVSYLQGGPDSKMFYPEYYLPAFFTNRDGIWDSYSHYTEDFSLRYPFVNGMLRVKTDDSMYVRYGFAEGFTPEEISFNVGNSNYGIALLTHRLIYVPSQYYVAPYVYLNTTGPNFQIYPLVDARRQFYFVPGSVDKYKVSLDGTGYWEGYMIANMQYPIFVTVSNKYTPYMMIDLSPSTYVSVKTDSRYYNVLYGNPTVRVSEPLFVGVYIDKDNKMYTMYPSRLLPGAYDSYIWVQEQIFYKIGEHKGISISYGKNESTLDYIHNSMLFYGFPHVHWYDINFNGIYYRSIQTLEFKWSADPNDFRSESFEILQDNIIINFTKTKSGQSLVDKILSGLTSSLPYTIYKNKDKISNGFQKAVGALTTGFAVSYSFKPTAVNPVYGSVYGSYTIIAPTSQQLHSDSMFYIPVVFPNDRYQVKLGGFGADISTESYIMSDYDLILRLEQVGSYEQ